jgi:hypothetical protein
MSARMSTLLAGPALRGRGSATPDEAAAAAYVAAMFRGYGLAMAPGMTTYTQPIDVVSLRLDGAPVLTANGAAVDAPMLFSSTGQPVRGKLVAFAGTDPKQVPAADAVIVTGAGVNGHAVRRRRRSVEGQAGDHPRHRAGPRLLRADRRPPPPAPLSSRARRRASARPSSR